MAGTMINLPANALANAARLDGDGRPLIWRDDGTLRLATGVRITVGTLQPALVRSCKRAAPWLGVHDDLVVNVDRGIDVIDIVEVDRAASTTAARVADAVIAALDAAGLAFPGDLRDSVRSVVEVNLAPVP